LIQVDDSGSTGLFPSCTYSAFHSAPLTRLLLSLERSVQSLCEPLLRLEAVSLASIVTDLHNTLCICVGDAMPARYEYNSSIVSIVLVLGTFSQPCILGLVRSLTTGQHVAQNVAGNVGSVYTALGCRKDLYG
jgi:hypothetical protein